MPRLMVIIASTRAGRAGMPIAEWFLDTARQHARFHIDAVDLKELDLPFLDEPNHPRLRQYTQQHTRDWSARVDAADAFVFVMPEYNFGFNAPLKNALDFVFHEWAFKPVGFVSYGGLAAGTRAVQMIKQVAVALKMTPLYEAVNVPFFAQFIDAEGRFQATEAMRAAAVTMLDELLRVQAGLRPLRP